jgi:hypothetical protein
MLFRHEFHGFHVHSLRAYHGEESIPEFAMVDPGARDVGAQIAFESKT